MAQIGREGTSIGPVTPVGSPTGEVGIPSLPGAGGRPVRRSEPPARGGAEVALPDLSKVIEALKSYTNIGLTYVVDRETHSVIIKVIDRETNEVVREVPPEEITRLRAVMRDLYGLLLKAEA